MRSIKLIRYLVLVAMLAGLVVLVHSPVSASPPAPDRGLEEMLQSRSLSLHFPAPSTVASSSVASHATPIGPNCRYGANVSSQPQMDWLPDLGAGWYLNFKLLGYPATSSARFVATLWVTQDKIRSGPLLSDCRYLSTYTFATPLNDGGLGFQIAAHPGTLWVISTEPERGPNPPPADCMKRGQADTYPAVYARAYHDAYQYIKRHDPTAQVAVAALVEITPGRLQYLDRVLQAYRQYYGEPMPVDVWNMHLYILPEATSDGQPNGIASVALGTDLSLAMRESGGNPARCGQPGVYCFADHDNIDVFAGQVRAMRAWMKANGQQGKPLIITEYSQLYPYVIDAGGTCFLKDEFGHCFTQQRVIDFLNRSFSYLENTTDLSLGYPSDNYRLVQQWMWFSVNFSGAGYVSNLVTNDLSSLTAVGAAFRTAVQAQPLVVNLFPDPLPGTVAGRISPATGTGTVTLRASVRNNGNSATGTPITVRFYADAGLSQVIGSAQSPAGLGGCTMSRATVSVNWSGLALGKHPYWVQVDSTSAVVESNEADNVANGIAEIFAHGAILPVMMR